MPNVIVKDLAWFYSQPYTESENKAAQSFGFADAASWNFYIYSQLNGINDFSVPDKIDPLDFSSWENQPPILPDINIVIKANIPPDIGGTKQIEKQNVQKAEADARLKKNMEELERLYGVSPSKYALENSKPATATNQLKTNNNNAIIAGFGAVAALVWWLL